MTHNAYRLLIGALILIFLYFDLTYFMWGLIGVLLVEGLTNIRLPKVLNRLLRLGAPKKAANTTSSACPRLSFDSEQMMSLLLGLILVASYLLFNSLLWFLPWFMGFALIGSGASGFCPMLIVLKRLGFK